MSPPVAGQKGAPAGVVRPRRVGPYGVAAAVVLRETASRPTVFSDPDDPDDFDDPPLRRLSFIPFALRPPLIPAACRLPSAVPSPAAPARHSGAKRPWPPRRPLPGLPLRPGISEQNAPGRSAASVRFVRCSPSPPPPTIKHEETKTSSCDKAGRRFSCLAGLTAAGQSASPTT